MFSAFFGAVKNCGLLWQRGQPGVARSAQTATSAAICATMTQLWPPRRADTHFLVARHNSHIFFATTT